jgi:hypothetical protein
MATMTRPIDIEFHGIQPTEWIEADIRRRAVKLDTFCRNILSCRVTVDRPHRHHLAGNRFQLRIDVMVPGGEISVSRAATWHAPVRDRHVRAWAKEFEVEGRRKDVQLVVREAFDVARRRLQDFVRRQRGEVKTHRPRARRRPEHALQESA